MATVTKPMALDETLQATNAQLETTDATPVNIADVLQTGLADVASAINSSTTPDASDVSFDDTSAGLGVSNVQDAIDEIIKGPFQNAGFHNSIYRGTSLGTSVTATQQAQIQAGTFDDMFIGDYWTINGTKYVIAAFDYYLHTGDTECKSYHITLVPSASMYSAQMNTSNTTSGGYVGSAMYTTNLATAKATITSDFGDLVMSHRHLLTNAVSSGIASGWSWYDSTVELMSEAMVYGQPAWRSCNTYEVGICKSQLPLFRLNPESMNNRETYWLRDVVSATNFSDIYTGGHARTSIASYSLGVRPAFSIYVA